MSKLSEEKINTLNEKSQEIRRLIIEMLYEAGSGHLAGSLGMADIFSNLYFHTLKYKPKNPKYEDRDRLILSNGHIAPVLYASMALAGFFSENKLKTLRKMDSSLQGHPEREKLPGLETTSGPLGLGLGQASGIVTGAKMDKKDFRVYCIMSDGEQQEGNTWESAMFASHNNLSNLIAIIDRNNIQISGNTKNVLSIEPLKEKYESFGFNTIEINGHNQEEITNAINEAKEETEKPTVIIANTIPGKGVKEIENDYTWHGKAPNSKTQMDSFLKQLKESGNF